MNKPDDPTEQELKQMRQRVDLLERDNQRLREQLEPLTGPYNPCFDPAVFQRALQRITLQLLLPVMLMPLVVPFLIIPKINHYIPNTRIGPLPLIDIAGMSSGTPGIGLGIIAVGGLSVGVIAVGGAAVGLVAVGGSAIGVIAVGGGSVGLIAIGGGAFGYIAIGGGAAGRYALGKRAWGRYALGLNRQDQPAIDLFVRWFPRLRAAVTTPMPVIPLAKDAS
jgi:hypothetical protein